jgi:hypothetical protein
MLRRPLVRLTVVLMLGTTLGMHWAVLQGMAWTAMFMKQVQSLPVSVALSYTFDGEHACEWCRVVRDGKAEEKARQESRMTVKLEGVLPPISLVACQMEETLDLGSRRASTGGLIRREPPPLPPPRA